MTCFVLIHGGLHGGWCWEHVVPLLEAEGHTALAPDLPAMGKDRTPIESVRLEMMGDFVADVVRAQREPVVLVGHSMGGISISEAAERVPDRVLGLVYLTANLGSGGQSMSETGGEDMDKAAGRGVIVSPDGLSSTYDPEIALDVFYNTTAPAEARRAIERLSPQPLLPVGEPLTVTDERFGRVPRAYIECLQDHALPIALQRRMHAALPCDPVVAMDTDHSPFLSAPAALARHLVAIAESFPGASR